MNENKNEITKINIDAEKQFSRCPSCGYDRGFHNIFKNPTNNGHLDWLLVCPQCGKIFDIGLIFTKR